MSTSEKKTRHTFQEYLQLEKGAEYKSEFYDGEIFAMSGGTRDHSVISANIGRELGNALIAEDCTVTGSDLKIRIEAANSAVYPDCTVICGPEAYFEDRRDIIMNPTIVIEVLSDSTAAWDRGGKFRKYGLLPSLKEYVLIEQKEAHIDVFRRNEQGFWVLEGYDGLEAMVELQSIGVTLNSGKIYHRVEFPSPKNEPG